MISLNKLRTIAKAKFSDKSNLGDWYKKRLEICSMCTYNSKNREHLTARDVGIVAMNLGKDSCLACTCEIDAKASVRSETCGLAKIGGEPLWEALPDIEKADYSDLKIENLSADKAKMIAGKQLIFQYKPLKRGQDSTIKVSIRDPKDEILSVDTRSGCSCTVTKPTKIGDTFFVSIKYNTNNLGNFNRDVTFVIRKKTEIKQFISTIKGTVVK